jgi:hypothetical protein
MASSPKLAVPFIRFHPDNVLLACARASRARSHCQLWQLPPPILNAEHMLVTANIVKIGAVR